MSAQTLAVYFQKQLAGLLTKEADGTYRFQYDESYLNNPNSRAISLRLPKRAEAFQSETLFPFFFHFLSEGLNRKLQERTYKIDENDHFALLRKTAGSDTIGAVTLKVGEDE